MTAAAWLLDSGHGPDNENTKTMSVSIPEGGAMSALITHQRGRLGRTLGAGFLAFALTGAVVAVAPPAHAAATVVPVSIYVTTTAETASADQATTEQKVRDVFQCVSDYTLAMSDGLVQFELRQLFWKPGEGVCGDGDSNLRNEAIAAGVTAAALLLLAGLTLIAARRRRIYLSVAGGCVLSYVIGAVFVRAALDALDALDAQPYDGPKTEHAYLAVAVVALVIWWGGTAASVIVGCRHLRRRSPREAPQRRTLSG